MPDEVLTTLFQRAWSLVEAADDVLDVREEILILRRAAGGKTSAEAVYVRSRGWANMFEFNKAVLELRTACYIVAAALSGAATMSLVSYKGGLAIARKKPWITMTRQIPTGGCVRSLRRQAKGIQSGWSLKQRRLR